MGEEGASCTGAEFNTNEDHKEKGDTHHTHIFQVYACIPTSGLDKLTPPIYFFFQGAPVSS